MTTLANLALLRDRLIHALAMAKRKKQEVGIVLLGLDRFHEIKTQLGPEGGDAVLAATAERLKRCMREVDTVARLGGDLFTCLPEGVSSKGDMEIVARRIRASTNSPSRSGILS